MAIVVTPEVVEPHYLRAIAGNKSRCAEIKTKKASR
jgi:hypothetical protein